MPTSRSELSRVFAVGGLISLLTVGCGDGAGQQVGVDQALLQPLAALGECGPAPPPLQPPVPVDGLVLPDGAVVTQVTPTDPVVTVQGWVPLTPIQLRVDYAGADDLEVLQVEDEVWEAEVLATDGDHRLFVKAQAVCDAASVFIAVVAPEAAAGAVPTPAQGG